MPYIVPVYNSEKRKRKFDLAGIEAKLIFNMWRNSTEGSKKNATDLRVIFVV
jgi:hypothetical protein